MIKPAAVRIQELATDFSVRGPRAEAIRACARSLRDLNPREAVEACEALKALFQAAADENAAVEAFLASKPN